LEVGNGGPQGTVADIVGTSREDIAALDEGRRSAATSVVEVDDVPLGLDTDGSRSDYESESLEREHCNMRILADDFWVQSIALLWGRRLSSSTRSSFDKYTLAAVIRTVLNGSFRVVQPTIR